ncbi:organic cation transporter protein [Caerostris darwini]|uniref:Organic cation transporter protein n=1 Tax=Caerostris darwini TaxID=1538125 RepID=A0AAV4TQ12_9ARAC|nr:organic cation transporter protein [Caerostris darwini]
MRVCPADQCHVICHACFLRHWLSQPVSQETRSYRSSMGNMSVLTSASGYQTKKSVMEKTCPPKKAEDDGQRDLMELVKGHGPWQWRMLTVVIISCMFEGLNNMAMVFFAPNLDHWCARPPDANISVEEWKKIAIPPGDQHCSMYKFFNVSDIFEENLQNSSTNRETVTCSSWEYDDSTYQSTVLSEWDLVCHREWLVSLSKSVYIAGFFCSAVSFTYLADKYGRKPVLIVCNIIAVISAILCAYSTSFAMFAVARFCLATGASGIEKIGFVLLMEIISPEFRATYALATDLAWIAGALCLPAIAWFLRNWFWMQIVITLPSIVLLACFWLIPESPRWLLAHEKADEAMKILTETAHKNGLDPVITNFELKEAISKSIKANENDDKSVNILQLFKPELRKRTCVIWFVW